MDFSIRAKVIIMTILAAIAPVMIIMVITMNIQDKMLNKSGDELVSLANSNINQITYDAFNICQTSHELFNIKNKVAINILRAEIDKNGGLSFKGELLRWKIKNQLSGEVSEIDIPKAIYNGKWIGKTDNFEDNSEPVDMTTRLADGTVTIFQRINKEGDMLRIATTVKNAEGNRAIGTYIPAVNPNGVKNPVLSEILKGKPYEGIAYVVNDWYVSYYEPYYDKDSNIVGMIYVGEKLNSLTTLENVLKNMNVGKSGYIYIIGTVPPHKDKFIWSRNGIDNGKNISDFRDSDGNLIFNKLQEEFKNNSSDGLLQFNFSVSDSTGKEIQFMSSAKYFKTWNWIIGAVAPESDFLHSKSEMEYQFKDLQMMQFLTGIGVLLIVIVITSILGGRLTKPLIILNRVASRIAEGNISYAKDALVKFRKELKLSAKELSKDDAVMLFNSFAAMVSNLDSLIGQVQKSGIQVTTSATEIAASARELEATIAEQAASTREVNATSREISSVSVQLSGRMNDVKENVENTSIVAEKGRETLLNMEKAMNDLTKATVLISAKLSIISGKAGKISAIVTTINKISEQTNLLSLNAAIEAEKAGDFGKGFAVVAREISRLADQTAIATKDIEYMVKEMQSSVSSGVMEVDKFGQEVKNNYSVVTNSVDNLNDILDKVHALIPEFDSVNQSMNSQSHGAGQISEAMNQLSQVAEQTKESLGEFKKATEQLNEAVRGLQNEVTKFKIS
ncbi:MAG: methyl-accepting chemotaxis protein [Candidatus Kapabacteria bacterium]|nr:methyl-accepting chemotaxis protein [Ignavibacteriota bacterium]MCW5886020.1 methyl-accepting chemotaxis protein [Candidatus Kapabacteria bacterium]